MNITLARNLKSWSAPEDRDFKTAIEHYLKGDHYQDGVGWIGPVPNNAAELEQLRKMMINDGVFRAALRRALLAVVGAEPYFYVTDKNAEESQVPMADVPADPADAAKLPVDPAKGTDPAAKDQQNPNDAQDTVPEDKSTQEKDGENPASGRLDPNKTLDKVKTQSKNQKKIDEANDLLTNYWDTFRLHKTVMLLTASLIAHNRAVARLLLPEDALDEDEDYSLNDVTNGTTATNLVQKAALDTAAGEPRVQEVSFASIEEAMNSLTFQTVPLESGGFVRDEDQRIVGAFYKYTNPISKKMETEVTYWSKAEKKTCVELLNESGTLDVDSRAYYEIDGRLTIFEISGAGLVKPDILTHLRAVDHATTMLVMNNSFAGFRERLFLNAAAATRTEYRNGERQEVEVPMDSGPGTDAYIQGMPIEDPVTGEIKGFATPNIVYKDPINQDGLIKSISHHVQRILENMHQGHILISGDATTSGTSRQQAVQDHIASINLIEQEVEALLRWMLESLLHFSAHLAGKSNYFEDLKVVVQCRVSALTPTPEERKIVVEEYNSDLRSRENAMTSIGIDDPVAERNQIIREKIEDLDTGLSQPPIGQIPDPNNPGRTIPDPSLMENNEDKKPTSPGNF